MSRIADGVLGGLSTSTVNETESSSPLPTQISSGEDSNIVFRDAKGKILSQPASLSEIATIDVYYL